MFRKLTEEMSRTSCSRIGLKISVDPFEYPLWVLLRERGLRPTIKHLESHAGAPVPLDPTFALCAVLSAGGDPQYADAKALQFGDYVLYLIPEPGAAGRTGS